MKHVFRLSFILTIITAMIHIPMFAQTYESLWKQVKEAEEKSLPKTVLDRRCLRRTSVRRRVRRR